MRRLFVCIFVVIACGTLCAKDRVYFHTSFEDEPQGAFTALKTDLGVWTASKGHAEINDHFKSGRQCLRILGGEKHVAEFVPDLKGCQVHEMSFWAERWTSRKPFMFRILAQTKSGWNEIYNGDDKVRVGRSFLSHVKVSLPEASIRKLRFECTSPANSGILIDDLSFSQPIPMSLEGMTTAQKVAPVLIGKDNNPVVKISINTVGSIDPLDAVSFVISTKGTTNLNDIDSVRMFYTGVEDRFSTKVEFGTVHKLSVPMVFSGRQKLTEGTNNFWVSYKLKDNSDMFGKVDAECINVVIKNDEVTNTHVPGDLTPGVAKRIGYSIRDRGDDGVPGYRIPGLATTNKGTLIAVYDIRRHGMGDLPGNVDVGMSRSTDGGQSWSPMKVVMDMGEPHKSNGIGDPSILVDRATNTIWVAAVWSHGNRAWHGSRPGMTPRETGQFILVNSADDGKTWSEPINITPQIKDPKWYYLLQGPGNGITLRDGTLVFPAQFKDENNMPHSTIIYSIDRGKTWTIGSGAKSNTTEAQVVELNNGSLMLNMRDNRGGARSVYTTNDLGRTWQVHSTSRKSLPEPVCMASLIRFSSVKDGDDRNILLFSNPHRSSRPRSFITIKASLDEGASWPKEYHKLIHEPSCAGYSCMTKVNDETVGILYEGGDTALLVFEKFRISEILGE